MGRLTGLFLTALFAVDAYARTDGGIGRRGGVGGVSRQLVLQHPVFVLLGVGIALYLIAKSSGGSGGTFLSRSGRVTASRLATEPSADRLSDISKMRIADPGYDEAAFVRRAGGAFLAVQDAWSRQDMRQARAFLSDGVFAGFTRQIADQKERGVRNRLSSVTIREAQVLGYRRRRHFDAVFLAISASAVDEIISLKTGDLYSGGPTQFTEVWTFLRRPGAKTRKGPGLFEGKCPDCAAPLSATDAAQCVACKSWVNSGEHDWVLAAITPSDAWGFPDSDREIPGWTALSAADPGLSLEALEDRAALAFWRGIGEPDAVLGAATVVACEKNVGNDRVHVRIRWETGQRERREIAFVFERRSGVLSDSRQGLGGFYDGKDPWVVAETGPLASWIHSGG